MEAVDQIERPVLIQGAAQRTLLRPAAEAERRRRPAKIVNGESEQRITLRRGEVFQHERMNLVRMGQALKQHQPRGHDFNLAARVQAARNDDRDLHVCPSALYSATVRAPIASQLRTRSKRSFTAFFCGPRSAEQA